MKVVLADIEEPALARVKDELQASGASVLAVRTDVSKAADVELLARKTLRTFSGVHLLFNNAGVLGGGTAWESSSADWEWVLGVNLWGMINGLRTFVPIMLAQDTECHIVNTASNLALRGYTVSAPYQTSKYAVLGLSENLYYSLAQQNSKMKVSVLCPGLVNTSIFSSQRNRPHDSGQLAEPTNTRLANDMQALQSTLSSRMSPAEVADQVFSAIAADRFYILTHPESMPEIERRMGDILHLRNPSSL
jgi:NAD(P)-dependent dehydrogenase (short-subunit alcohol dehydrogenase family)